MIRLTLDPDTGNLVAHGRLGERPLMPDEIEAIRDAITPKPLPLWLTLVSIAAGIAAVAIIGGGIGHG